MSMSEEASSRTMSFDVTRSVARLARLMRLACMSPVRVRPVGDAGAHYSVEYSRGVDLCNRAVVATVAIGRAYCLYVDMFVGGILTATSERLIRTSELLIQALIVVGTGVTARESFENNFRFMRCCQALQQTGVPTSPGDIDRSLRYFLVLIVATVIMLIWDNVGKMVFTLKYDLFLTFTLFNILYMMKTFINATFAFLVCWLRSITAATIVACRRECEGASAQTVLATLRRAAARHRLVRAAQEYVCRAADIPVAFTVLLLYLHIIIAFYHFVVDYDQISGMCRFRNVMWILYNYLVLLVTVQPCHVFLRQDQELQEIMSATLQKIKRSSYSAADLEQFDIMWDRLAVIRSTKVEFKMLQVIHISRDLFLSVTSTMVTYIVVLVALKKP